MKLKLDLQTKKGLWGYVFVSPFVIGVLLFFIIPLVQTIIFSLNRIIISPAGFELEYIGLGNYNQIFLVDPGFVRSLVNLVRDTLANIPLIVLFSLFIASLLNHEFKGRFLARTIFFLPVIITAEAIMDLRESDFLSNVMDTTAIEETADLSNSVRMFLINLTLPEEFLNYFVLAVERIPDVIASSAIPIIIFLAGLQSIPASLYEAADVEGATGWERFWKITFPMITPLILVNIVYVIIDAFSVQLSQNALRFGEQSAMGISYFLVVTILIAIAYLAISKWIFYQE